VRRLVPTLIAVTLVAVVGVSAVLFAFSAPASLTRKGAPQSPIVTVAASSITSAFSLVDTQASVIKSAITAPRRLFDHPQRTVETQKRLAAYNRSFDPAPPDYLLAQGITRIKDAGNRVVLTFDDGPSANTSEVLGILTRYHVHATFFMVGRRVQAIPQLAGAVLAQGSELGNHTMTHQELWHATLKEDEAQIKDADTQFFKFCRVHPVYLRPKGGVVDDTGMAAIKAMNKVYVYWDVAGFDTVPDFTPADIRDTVLKDTRSGSVILLHETNPRTVQALPEILSGLKRRGFQVETLTEVLAH
jgi:peptidoglycan-N-acetylglucosamine deacetylase